MVQIKLSRASVPARKDTVRHPMELVREALIYLGIVATFAAVSLIACISWLLIW